MMPIKQVCVELPMSAVSMALPAVCHAAAPLMLSAADRAAIYWYILPTGCSAANRQQRCAVGQSDGQMDARSLHRPCSAYYVSSSSSSSGSGSITVYVTDMTERHVAVLMRQIHDVKKQSSRAADRLQFSPTDLHTSKRSHHTQSSHVNQQTTTQASVLHWLTFDTFRQSLTTQLFGNWSA